MGENTAMKKKLITSALLLSACFALAGCSEDSGETLKGQTDATMGKNVRHVKDPAMSYTKINHSVTFNGEKINFVAKYGIEKRYVHNWRFTNTEKVILSLKPVSDNPNLKLGINNVYSDVSISSSKTQYNAVRQDSVNLSYSQLPHGMVSISKNDGYSLPFQVESINENETSFYVINGYGKTDNQRITEHDLRENAYGAKLNVVWTVAITDKSGNTYFKTINDAVGIPYK